MADIPTTEPTQIQAGDLIQWKRTLADYPAGIWTLSYVLLNSANKITITATASGTDHSVSVAAATSAAWNPGRYAWQAYVTNGAQRFTVDKGEVDVLANFATQTTLDTRSAARQNLEAIDAELSARASGGFTTEYTIGSRSLKKETTSELLALRSFWQQKVNDEKNAERLSKGLPPNNRIYTRFR